MSDDDHYGDLFSISSAREAKAEGMALVESGASLRWMETMFAAVEAVARTYPYFTSDTVFAYHLEHGKGEDTRDRRAFGPVMMWAAKAGFCEKANTAPVASARRSLHASPRAVWKSLIFTGH